MKDPKDEANALRALAAMHHDECPASKAMRDKADELEAGTGKQKAMTNAYRVGYESIFGARQEVGQS